MFKGACNTLPSPSSKPAVFDVLALETSVHRTNQAALRSEIHRWFVLWRSSNPTHVTASLPLSPLRGEVLQQLSRGQRTRRALLGSLVSATSWCRVVALLPGMYCASLPLAVAARDKKYKAEVSPNVPTLFMYTVASYLNLTLHQVPLTRGGSGSAGVLPQRLRSVRKSSRRSLLSPAFSVRIRVGCRW